MKINFTKMHGIGNDYIYVNCMQNELKDPARLSERMSARRFSVGADGLVLICSSQTADARMRMFNADGSEGKMCGNAIRCVGKYLYDNGIVKTERMSIETLSGIKYLTLTVKDGCVRSLSVDMGHASFVPQEIPIASDAPYIDAPLTVDGRQWRVSCVSVGNPHQVIFTENIADLPLEKMGPSFENHPLFPERVNTEFVEQVGKNELKMRVWERGSGETWACGTGACAVCAAAVKLGRCEAGAPVTIHLIGGDLVIRCDEDYAITMNGPAEKVFDGVYEYED